MRVQPHLLVALSGIAFRAAICADLPSVLMLPMDDDVMMKRYSLMKTQDNGDVNDGWPQRRLAILSSFDLELRENVREGEQARFV